MRVIEARFYEGPNRHTYRPALEALVDLEAHVDWCSKQHLGHIELLLQALPGLMDHYCSRGHSGGFWERLHEGTFAGHVTEHVALELLHVGGESGTYGKTRDADDDGRVRIVIESETEPGGLGAVQHALAIVEGLAEARVDTIRERAARFREELGEVRLGPSTRAIVAAAKERGIPAARLDDQNLVRLGQGCRQRRIMATMTQGTSILGAELAQDKARAKAILRDAGIPVPRGGVATNYLEALDLAAELGERVVVKPLHGHQGEAVRMGITEPAELESAFREAVQLDPEVLVEQEIQGKAYRCLVVGGKLAAAAERIPPSVVGDGRRTVRSLIAALNQDPRRGPGHAFPMSRVVVGDAVEDELQHQGFRLDSVPSPGQAVRLLPSANLSTGASAKDVTRQVSAALAEDMVRAACAVGLDIAGVDVVTPALDRSLRESGGAVIEVNAAPGIRMHCYPAEGDPQPVGDRIVDYLFPPGNNQRGRIPTLTVTGTNGKTTVARMIGHVWSSLGTRVGMTTTDGIFIGNHLIQDGDLTGPWSARLVLNDPSVEVAVLETARGGMARGGLGFDGCDVAVVTNIGRDHLGQEGIESVEDLVHLKALLVEVVYPEGAAVLNADDPLVLKMAERTRGRIVLFSNKEDNLAVHKHLAEGGEAVFVRRGNLVYGKGADSVRLMGGKALPASLGGIARFNIANAAAAAAACIAVGIQPRLAARALASFSAGTAGTAESMNRGRLEMVYGNDLRVLIDYGHNAPAITALGAVCKGLRPKQVATVLGLPGDRRDSDLEASAAAAVAFSDRIVIREDYDRRGRAPGEMAEILWNACLKAGAAPEQLLAVWDEAEAVRRTVAEAPPGALVVALFERYWVARQAVEQALEARSQHLESPMSLVGHSS